MLSTEDLIEMFNDHLDGTYARFTIKDINFFPSEILEAFPNAYDKLFREYVNELDVTWIDTNDGDGYYTITTLQNKDN